MYLPTEPIDILIAENDRSELPYLEHKLQTSGLKIGKILTAQSMEEIRLQVQQESVHLVFFNLVIPASVGTDHWADIKELMQKVPVIFLTNKSDGAPYADILQYYESDYLVRGNYDHELLLRSVRYCIGRKKCIVQKQQLIKAALDTQEFERKCIGDELHNNINQVLTAVKLNLEMALAYPVSGERLITQSLHNVTWIIEDIRKLSRKFILSGSIKELGLVHSVRELIKEIQTTDIHFIVSAKNFTDTELSLEQKINLYRIIQEQLNNIINHAKASEVRITISMTNNLLLLEITDNGKGFDISRKGIGLSNIINRAELMHGKADIISEPGKGCQLMIRIPICFKVWSGRDPDRYKMTFKL